jgi:hypothetical protein
MSDMQGRERPGPDAPHEKYEHGHAPDLAPPHREYGDLSRPPDVGPPSTLPQRGRRREQGRDRSSARQIKPDTRGAGQTIQRRETASVAAEVLPKFELDKESPKLARLTSRVSSTDSYLTEQLTKAGISLTKSGRELDVVKGIDFDFQLRTTPSLRELNSLVSQLDRAIRVSAGLAAYTHPELRIWTGGNFQNLGSLEVWLQSNSDAWDLEIESLGLGSFRVAIQPELMAVQWRAEAMVRL